MAFLTKSMAENGMSINEIANALTMALTSAPDGASQELIAEIENYIQVGFFFLVQVQPKLVIRNF